MLFVQEMYYICLNQMCWILLNNRVYDIITKRYILSPLLVWWKKKWKSLLLLPMEITLKRKLNLKPLAVNIVVSSVYRSLPSLSTLITILISVEKYITIWIVKKYAVYLKSILRITNPLIIPFITCQLAT